MTTLVDNFFGLIVLGIMFTGPVYIVARPIMLPIFMDKKQYPVHRIYPLMIMCLVAGNLISYKFGAPFPGDVVAIASLVIAIVLYMLGMMGLIVAFAFKDLIFYIHFLEQYRKEHPGKIPKEIKRELEKRAEAV